ncbi:MAG: hypothetical protein ACRD0Y_00045 [Terriglobales bacterium]
MNKTKPEAALKLKTRCEPPDTSTGAARAILRYLFLGKPGAILLGLPDTTQDAGLFVEKSPQNARRVLAALQDLGFNLAAAQAEEIARGFGRRGPQPGRRACACCHQEERDARMRSAAVRRGGKSRARTSQTSVKSTEK